MKIVTDASLLLSQLRVISKLTPADSGNVSIVVKDNNMYLYSYANAGSYKSVVPCDECTGDEAFAVSIEPLKTMLAKRSKVTLQLVNTMLVITEKGYKAELSTSDPTEYNTITELAVEKEQVKKYKISVDQGKWLKSALAEVRLATVEALSPFMPITLKITDKGAFVACYDNNHLAFVRSKEMTGTLDLTVPCEMLISVVDAFQNSNFTMEVGENNVYVKNKLLNITLSLPLSDSYLQVDELLAVANQTLKAKGEEIRVSKASILDFMDSCKAVATKERSELKVKAQGKKLGMQVKTITGAVNQNITMEESCNTSFSLDFAYLEEAIRKSKNDIVTIKVIKDTSVLVGAKNGWSIISVFE